MCTRDNSRILKWDTMLHHTVDFTFHLDYAQGNVSEPIDQDLLKPRFPKDPVMIFFFLNCSHDLLREGPMQPISKFFKRSLMIRHALGAAMNNCLLFRTAVSTWSPTEQVLSNSKSFQIHEWSHKSGSNLAVQTKYDGAEAEAAAFCGFSCIFSSIQNNCCCLMLHS